MEGAIHDRNYGLLERKSHRFGTRSRQHVGLGRLVVASNLSDLCGSGALPVALLVGVTLPHGTAAAEFKDLMRGVKFEADRHGVPVVGGDSKLGKSRALLAVAIGSAQSRKQLFLKNGAKPGDIIWVSGNIGSVAAAVWGYCRAGLPRLWKAWARKALLRPRLPLKASRRISACCLGHGGTDISDGLGADLFELCKASAVGAVVNVEMIPTAPEVKRVARMAGVPAWRFAFASGGDFQFIVTTGKAARKQMNRFGLCEIGVITKHPRLRLRSSNGKQFPFPTKGHRDHCHLTFAGEINALIKSPRKAKIQIR